MAFKVYVTSNEIPQSALDTLRLVAQVKANTKDGALPRSGLLKEVASVDAILCLLTDRMDATVMGRAKRLKVVGNMAVGYDNVDITEATRRGIMVTNTPEVLTETVADLTLGLILAVARRLVEADRFVRDGRWKVQWSPMMMVGTDMHGKTLGIYGLGRIGLAVARRAKGFGMKVLYNDSVRNERAEMEHGLVFSTLDSLLATADFITIHVPLTPETRHGIGRREISLMKRSAFLINTSRGPVVDEKALYAALARRKIAGAALDVFEKEPITRDNPLLRLPNAVLLPHMGSASLETRTAMAELATRNVVAALRGETPPNLVNREVLNRITPAARPE